MKFDLRSRSIKLIYDFSSNSSSAILVESISWLCASDIHEISNRVVCRDICAGKEEDESEATETTKTTTKTPKTTNSQEPSYIYFPVIRATDVRSIIKKKIRCCHLLE